MALTPSSFESNGLEPVEIKAQAIAGGYCCRSGFPGSQVPVPGRLPLIDIGELVGVAQSQRLFGVEEDLARFGEARAAGGQ